MAGTVPRDAALQEREGAEQTSQGGRGGVGRVEASVGWRARGGELANSLVGSAGLLLLLLRRVRRLLALGDDPLVVGL